MLSTYVSFKHNFTSQSFLPIDSSNHFRVGWGEVGGRGQACVYEEKKCIEATPISVNHTNLQW